MDESGRQRFSDGKILTRKQKEIISGGLFILFMLWVFGIPQHFYWVKTPGSLFEKQQYQTKAYVLVFPDKTKAKNYKLVGYVDRHQDCNDGSDSCHYYYYLNKFDWPNGGYATFDWCIVNLGATANCTTNNSDSKSYDIQLTKELVK